MEYILATERNGYFVRTYMKEIEDPDGINWTYVLLLLKRKL